MDDVWAMEYPFIEIFFPYDQIKRYPGELWPVEDNEKIEN